MGIMKQAIHPPVDGTFYAIWVGHDLFLATRDAEEARNCVLRLCGNVSEPERGLGKVTVVTAQGKRLNGEYALSWAKEQEESK